MKRILATVLALMLLLSALALVSCGDSSSGGNEDDYTETVDPEAAARNLNAEQKFNITISVNTQY